MLALGKVFLIVLEVSFLDEIRGVSQTNYIKEVRDGKRAG